MTCRFGLKLQAPKYTKWELFLKKNVCTKQKLEESKTITAKNQSCNEYVLLTTQSIKYKD